MHLFRYINSQDRCYCVKLLKIKFLNKERSRTRACAAHRLGRPRQAQTRARSSHRFCGNGHTLGVTGPIGVELPAVLSLYRMAERSQHLPRTPFAVERCKPRIELQQSAELTGLRRLDRRIRGKGAQDRYAAIDLLRAASGDPISMQPDTGSVQIGVLAEAAQCGNQRR